MSGEQKKKWHRSDAPSSTKVQTKLKSGKFRNERKARKPLESTCTHWHKHTT